MLILVCRQLSDTVAQLRRKAAAAVGSEAVHGRLIFAGVELQDEHALSDYNVMGESVVHLVLREATGRGAHDIRMTHQVREQLRGTQLRDFIVVKKIGGKDIGAAGGGTAASSQHGVCSYVYLATRRGNAAQLALKVMINMGSEQSVQLRNQFETEHALLSDPQRLPWHAHVMPVLHTFTDEAHGHLLPGWNFDRDLVMPRTMFVVMPFVDQDLKKALKLALAEGQFGEARAVRVGKQLLGAIHHLKLHAVVHRDVKLDNILLANPGTDVECVVLTDFGMCFDLRKNRVEGYKVMMPYDGFTRGGAAIALAPEVTLPQPGPGIFLDYEKNDEWAAGLVLHELASTAGHTPFADMEHPHTFSDHRYRNVDAASAGGKLAQVVRGLMRVDKAARLSSDAAARILCE
jgi:serine/threonine protein kinase